MNKRVTQDEGLFFGARLTVVCKTQVICTDLLEYTIILHKTRFFFPSKEKKDVKTACTLEDNHIHIYPFSNPLTPTLKRGQFRNKLTKKSNPCSKST